jgi:hypothetical protein
VVGRVYSQNTVSIGDRARRETRSTPPARLYDMVFRFGFGVSTLALLALAGGATLACSTEKDDNDAANGVSTADATPTSTETPTLPASTEDAPGPALPTGTDEVENTEATPSEASSDGATSQDEDVTSDVQEPEPTTLRPDTDPTDASDSDTDDTTTGGEVETTTVEPDTATETVPLTATDDESNEDGQCPDAPPLTAEQEACSDEAACAAGFICLAAVDSPAICAADAIGAPIAPPPSCDFGTACPEPAVCDVTSPDADYMGCVYPECSSDEDCLHLTDASCEPGHELADSRGCRYLDCALDEQYVCPEGTRCNNDPVLARCQDIPCSDPEGPQCESPQVCGASGYCEWESCVTNSDCGCGSCVGGRCFEQPGICYPQGCP